MNITFAPCQGPFRCAKKGSWREKYACNMCSTCISKLEKQAARDAIKRLQQAYRDGIRPPARKGP